MKDIANRTDIDRLMRAFYSRAMTDPLIGHIFTDVAKLDLVHHLPVIGDFWETLLFRTGDYGRHRRNPLAVHGDLDAKVPLLPEHFDRWRLIFNETLNESFAGPTADFLKVRAEAIAARMLEFLGRCQLTQVISSTVS